jgi:hypothetical protein
MVPAQTHLCIVVVPSLIQSGSVLVLYRLVGALFRYVAALSRVKVMDYRRGVCKRNNDGMPEWQMATEIVSHLQM